MDNGKLSRNIDLDRGFMQGDGPSPRLYNIGKQILLFRLEYDPRISGVYLTFLIPRTVVNDLVRFPELEKCEEAGITVEPELKHHNRKVPAFADDSNGAFKRDAENLGRISGLETNVEKTTLMPIGCLKGTVSRDFLLLVFFMNQFPPSPRVSH